MIQCACGSHDTDVVIVWDEYIYKGYVQTVERRYTECQDCGLEFQTAEQSSTNNWHKFEAKSTIDQWILDEQGE